MDQPTKAPTQKMTAVGISGAVTLVVIWLVSQFGVDLPAEVASALTIIISFVAGYLTPEKVAQAIDTIQDALEDNEPQAE